jgi:CheY-like chemotaxis protein
MKTAPPAVPTSHPSAARVMVASDKGDDAAQVLKQLERDFTDLHASTDPARAVADFEGIRPDVLVLGFDSLEKAQDYSVSLYRACHQVQPHRTLLLCSKGEVRAAFDLCKKGTFDDYLLFWPHAQDGQRLAMSVWNAARLVIDSPAREAPDGAQLGAMQALLDREVAEGERHAASAEESLKEAERAITAAIDELSQRLERPDPAAAPGAIARQVDGLKRPVSAAFEATTTSIAPTLAWPRRLQDKLTHRINDLRAIRDRIRKVKPVVFVVDDDEVQQALIEGALRDTGYELVFAPDGATALQLARRVRPDLILMDVHLPDADGVTLTQTLKEHAELASVPVLMLTGDARRETLTKSLGAGAVGFIVKPFTRDSLLAKLDRFLSTGA